MVLFCVQIQCTVDNQKPYYFLRTQLTESDARDFIEYAKNNPSLGTHHFKVVPVNSLEIFTLTEEEIQKEFSPSEIEVISIREFMWHELVLGHRDTPYERKP